MVPPQLDRDWLRNAALLTTVGVILFAVLTILFVDLVTGGVPAGADQDAVPPPSPVEERRDAEPAPDEVDEPVADAPTGPSEPGAGADPAPAPVEDRVEPIAEPEPGGADAGARRVPAPAPVDNALDLITVRDDNGFFFDMPPGWRERRLQPSLGEDPLASDYDVIFESPGGEQRIAVSVWDAAERAAFPAWVMSVAGGMRSVDGNHPTNAYIAGLPALVVGEAETPTSPLRYAAFLAKHDRYVRIAWSSPDGSVGSTDFMRTLATFDWPDVTTTKQGQPVRPPETARETDEATAGIAGGEGGEGGEGAIEPGSAAGGAGDSARDGGMSRPNQAPRLQLPAGLYFPSEHLYAAPTTP